MLTYTVSLYIPHSSIGSLPKEWSNTVLEYATKKMNEFDADAPENDAKVVAVAVGATILEHRLWCISNRLECPEFKFRHKKHPTKDEIEGYWVDYLFTNADHANRFEDFWS